MLYEFSAFIRVHADDQQQAEGIVDAFVDQPAPRRGLRGDARWDEAEDVRDIIETWLAGEPITDSEED